MSRFPANVPRTGLLAAALIAVCAPMAPALAAPSAIVENVVGILDNLEVMDYVEPGRVLQLKAGDVLVLGYLKSCLRETIAGGKVTVGADQSQVDGGKVERAKFACDGTKLQLTSEQSGKSGATVFRRVFPDKPASDAPQITIYSTAPAVSTAAPGLLTIERIDRAGLPVTVKMTKAKLDLAKAGVKLEPGGMYRAVIGEKKVVFSVDEKATPGAGPLVGRLIQF